MPSGSTIAFADGHQMTIASLSHCCCINHKACQKRLPCTAALHSTQLGTKYGKIAKGLGTRAATAAGASKQPRGVNKRRATAVSCSKSAKASQQAKQGWRRQSTESRHVMLALHPTYVHRSKAAPKQAKRVQHGPGPLDCIHMPRHHRQGPHLYEGLRAPAAASRGTIRCGTQVGAAALRQNTGWGDG